MDEQYEKHLRNRFEAAHQLMDQSGMSCFREAVQYYYHHSVGSIARSLSEMLKGKATDIVVFGIVDRERGTGKGTINVPYVQYEGVANMRFGGEKFRSEIPLGELNPEDFRISKLKKENAKNGRQ